MKLCVVMWVLPCVFSIVCITSFETSPIRNIKKYSDERDAGMYRDTRLLAEGYMSTADFGLKVFRKKSQYFCP